MYTSQLLLLLSLWAIPDSATMYAPHLSVTVITPAQDFSAPFDVGVYFSLEPEWYLYWKNPGDAGIPVAVTWSLPKGFHADPIEYPTPERIVHGDVFSYGFHNELLLTVRVTPPAAYTPKHGDLVTANLDWLVCRESCIPGGTTVSLDLSEQTPKLRRAASDLFSRLAGRKPQGLDVLGVSANQVSLTSDADGSRVTIALEGANRTAVTDFFPESLEDFVIDHKRISVINGTITVPITPYSSTSSLQQMRGLVMVGDRGYSLTVQVQKR